MKIYIATNNEKTPVGVVLAASKEFAEVAFTALRCECHNIEEIDPNSTDLPNVVYLLTSSKVNTRDYSHRSVGTDLILMKRGLS